MSINNATLVTLFKNNLIFHEFLEKLIFSSIKFELLISVYKLFKLIVFLYFH